MEKIINMLIFEFKYMHLYVDAITLFVVISTMNLLIETNVCSKITSMSLVTRFDDI
jgi:hypothetical protein